MSRSRGGSGVPLAKLSGTIQNDILKEYIARGTYIYPPRAVAADRHRHLCVVRARAAELEHDFDQRLSHPRSRVDGRAGSRVHVRATRSRTWRRRSDAGLDVNRFGAAAVVLFRRAQRLSRGDREVPRRAAAVGAHHARPVRRDAIRARCSCASIRRPPAARSPPSSPTTTSSAWRFRRWRPCSAARSPSTATAATKRSRCRPRRPRASRSARSRSSRPRPVSPTRSIRSAAACAIEQLTDDIEREARRALARIDAAGGTLAAIESGLHSAPDSGAAYARPAGHRSRRRRRRRRQPVRHGRSAARSTVLARRPETSSGDRSHAVEPSAPAATRRAWHDGARRRRATAACDGGQSRAAHHRRRRSAGHARRNRRRACAGLRRIPETATI